MLVKWVKWVWTTDLDRELTQIWIVHLNVTPQTERILIYTQNHSISKYLSWRVFMQTFCNVLCEHLVNRGGKHLICNIYIRSVRYIRSWYWLSVSLRLIKQLWYHGEKRLNIYFSYRCLVFDLVCAKFACIFGP